MYGTWCETHFIPDKLTVKMGNNGRQHPPKLKLLLVLKQISNWCSVDQELHQCSYPADTLCTTYYSNPICTLNKLAHTLVSGRWCLLAFHPSSWAVERLNNLHRNISCLLFRFLSRSFASFFKSGLKFPNGTLKSLKVYDPHHDQIFLTIFFLI